MDRVPAWAAALGVAVMTAACGSDETSSSTPPADGGGGEGGGGASDASGSAGASGSAPDASAGASGAGGAAGTSGSGGAAGSDATDSGAGAGGTMSTGGSAGASGTGAGYIACDNPTELQVSGQNTGFVRCGTSDVWHRALVLDCPTLLPRAGWGCSSALGGVVDEPCMTDLDCTTRALGFCTTVPTSHYPGCGCVYGCITDADCEAGQICECGDPVGRCRSASCTRDADCEAGSVCASTDLGWGGCTWTPPERGYECQSSADTCLTDADCASPLPACAFEAGTRTCHEGQLLCP